MCHLPSYNMVDIEKSLIPVYQYSDIESWELMQAGKKGEILAPFNVWTPEPKVQYKWVDGGILTGLRPGRKFIGDYYPGKGFLPNDAPYASLKGAFCFLQPEPEEWINNTEFPGEWRRLITHITKEGNLLVRVDVTKEDKAYVVDWAQNLRKGARAYYESMQELFAYDGSHSLPEVVIFNTIPKNRLTLERKVEMSSVRDFQPESRQTSKTP